MVNDRALILNADQLRQWRGEADTSKLKRQEIYIILDNVLDTYNIGSIFRLADAVSAKKIYLCSGSETPPNPRIKKASINTTDWVEWGYYPSTLEAIKKLRQEVPNIQLVAVEQSDKALLYDKFNYQLPVGLIVGHESDGVSQEVLDQVDGIVELPMFGVNVSLNVMVSLGIVLYEVIEKTS